MQQQQINISSLLSHALLIALPLIILSKKTVAEIALIALVLCFLLFFNALFIFSIRNLVNVNQRLIVIIVSNTLLLIIIGLLAGVYAFSVTQQISLFLPLLAVNAFVVSRSEHFFYSHSFFVSLKQTASLVILLLIVFFLFGMFNQLLVHGMFFSGMRNFPTNTGDLLSINTTLFATLFESAAGLLFLLAMVIAMINKLSRFNDNMVDCE